MIRFSIKKTIFLLIICTIAFQTYYLHENIIKNFNIISSAFYNDDASYMKSDQYFKEKLHYNNYISPIYSDILKSVSPIEFASAPKDEKCDLFFNKVSKLYNQDWKISNFDTDVYDKDLTNKKKFFQIRSKQILTKKKKLGKPEILSYQDNITISNDFYTQYSKTLETESKMADSTTIMRVFNTCYLENYKQQQQQKNESVCQLSKKIIPWLDETLPTFERFDRTTIISDGIPDFTATVADGDLSEIPVLKYDSSKQCYIHYLHENYNGRGIVISVTNKHSRDVVKLIRVLRGLNNTLPIQIINKDDISQRNKKQIVNAARDANNLQNVELTDYPPQELWFVNIKHCINSNYRNKFSSYSNKLLAYILNSFTEFILIDADTVPLVPIDQFFNTQQYLNTKTLFFKDRTLSDTNEFFETNLFAKLSSNSLDTEFFNIPSITNHTLQNHYMKGHRHLMEAGVVALSKREHFIGMLMSVNIHLWHITHTSVWGDKEMYWLGLSIMGDENYAFNDNFAASIGQASFGNDRHYPDSPTHEICSSHPGHLNSDGQLMWINSGFKYCKKNGYYKDRMKFPFSNYEKDDISKLFKKPLTITHALVPPAEILPMNDIKEFPVKGWDIQNICSGYQYCAYDVIGNGSDTKHGTFIEFEATDVNRFENLGKLWVGLDEAT